MSHAAQNIRLPFTVLSHDLLKIFQRRLRLETGAQTGAVHNRRMAAVRALVVLLGLLSTCACGGGWGSSASSSVAPGITGQPASQTVTVGQTATFAVTASGTAPLSYQWEKDGAAIRGATSAAYTTPVTQLSDSGSSFTVMVSNASGTATSAAATLTVNDTTPLATSLIASLSTPAYNSSVSLVPVFSGGTAVIGSSGAGSSDITASASSGVSYNTPALTASKTYTLTVTSPGGTVASIDTVVTPTSVSFISISPDGQTMAPGQYAFTASVTGGTTNTVTWSANGGTFSGNLWTSPTTAGTYTITATSADDSSQSLSTTVTISEPVINTPPSSQSICTGASAILSVVADYATSYQWNLDGSPISGATSSTYTATNAGSYTITVTNAAGSITSSAAKLGVGSSIISNPASLSIYATQTATFSVAAQGVGPFSYQWYKDGSPISGATSSRYTTPAATTGDSGTAYYAQVTDSCVCALDSSSATLTVTDHNVPPTIITQPLGVAVTAGDTADFTVEASGTGTLSYQWYRVAAGEVAGTIISGATSTTYTATDTQATNDQDAYYVVVSNSYGQATSQKATLAVGDGILLQIDDQPASVYVEAGASATFKVVATSTLALSYQWYKAAPGSSSFTAISGATRDTYTVSSAASGDSGSVFYVVVSNGSTSDVESSSAALFVGTLAGIDGFCGTGTSWTPVGDATTATVSSTGCTTGYQLTASTGSQHGEIVWPSLIATGNMQLSFAVTISGTSSTPADGFAMVLGDPSLGATTSTTGAAGEGLGAQGIPGFVLGFDTYYNSDVDLGDGVTVFDPSVPYLGVGRGENALWENPWTNVNTNIGTLASYGSTYSHAYVVSIVQGKMTVTMDGGQVFSGDVTVPPVAYLYFTASTGGYYEKTVISDLSATISAPSN